MKCLAHCFKRATELWTCNSL